MESEVFHSNSLFSNFKKIDGGLFASTDAIFNDAYFDALQSTYPSDDFIYQRDRNFISKGLHENFRYQIPVAELLGGVPLCPAWTRLFNTITPNYFRAECAKFFGFEIERYYGKEFLDFFTTSDIGYRGIDSTPLVFDFQIGINSPLTEVGSVRGVHLDNPVEVFAMLVYFPEVNKDDSALVINRKNGDISKYGKMEFSGCFDEVTRVPYHRNHAAAFLNSKESFHSVTPRSPSKSSRKLLNIIIEINPKYRAPLFSVHEVLRSQHGHGNGFRRLFEKFLRR